MRDELAEAFRAMDEAAARIISEGEIDIGERMIADLYCDAEQITQAVCVQETSSQRVWQKKADDIILSRTFGYPLMVLLLGAVFWLTIVGTNVPSVWLGDMLFGTLPAISDIVSCFGVPTWLHDILIYGVLQCLAWVIAVMLPPMAIFFTLFTLLEDWGYLPRAALCLDHLFHRCHACGKQALTMCMGFGCNAAGVVACRIIDSPRERLIAMLTNAFVPCNGRFPTLLILATLAVEGIYGSENSLLAVVTITGIVLLGVGMTFLVSRLLADTVLEGEPSAMILELPPYRMPQFGEVIYRSLWERSRFVLMRAVCVAAPAGLVIWLLAHTAVGDTSLLVWLAHLLDTPAWWLGIDGAILLAFILGIPANEIVLPILLM
ncbi:MAG: ferrous iron transporter B, partial [Selenomonadales bacterium]|nr:ferrous iron transporter B [Selenomonadales bacterium]